MLLEFAELCVCAVFNRQVYKFEKDDQMVVKFTVFQNLLNQLDDKQTLACSTLAKQHEISFFVGLLSIPKYPLNLTQKLEMIRIVIFSTPSLVHKAF